MAEALFYLLAALTLAFAVGVVRSRMPVFSVLNLLGAFFCFSAIYLLIGFPFLAVAQLLVYAGAIMVLFLFVIMLLNLGDVAQLTHHEGLSLSGRRLIVAGASAALLALVGVIAVNSGSAAVDGAAEGRGTDDLGQIAQALLGRYMLPFEASSLLLLATMIAVILLAKRQREDSPRAADTGTGAAR